MSWRAILAIAVLAAVLLAALVIVYATPFGSRTPPMYTATGPISGVIR